MITNRFLVNLTIFFVLVSSIGCDQISKNYVRSTIPLNEQFRFFGDHVMFTRVENSGAFLSLGDNLAVPVKFVILVLIPFLALLVGMYFLFMKSSLSKSTRIALSFVIGGGIGNIYDRYIYGSVTDFVHVDLGLIRTGIFNLADVSIMTGVLIIFMTYIVRRNRFESELNGDTLS